MAVYQSQMKEEEKKKKLREKKKTYSSLMEHVFYMSFGKIIGSLL